MGAGFLTGRGVVALAMIVAAVVAFSGAAHASQRYRWFVMPLTPVLIENFIRCAPRVFEAERRINAKITGTTKDDASRRYKSTVAEQMRLFEECNLPAKMHHSFRSVSRSIYLADGLNVPPPSGARDKNGQDIEEEQAEAPIRAQNVIVVAPFKTRLQHFYKEQKIDVSTTPRRRPKRTTATEPRK